VTVQTTEHFQVGVESPLPPRFFGYLPQNRHFSLGTKLLAVSNFGHSPHFRSHEIIGKCLWKMLLAVFVAKRLKLALWMLWFLEITEKLAPQRSPTSYERGGLDERANRSAGTA
jgi:hypothetical protein